MTTRPLPSGWEWKPFGEVATIESNLVSPADHGQMPHIAPNHIESWTGRLLPYTTVAQDGVKSPKHLFRAGQVIYSKIRPYLAKATLVDFDGLCSADMYPLSTSLEPRFLLRWLLTPEFTNRVVQDQGRTVLPKVNQDALLRVPVPVPPIDVQRRIVAKLDELLAKTRAAREQLEAVPALVEQYRQSVLAAAFRGDLTADWRKKNPDVEPASKLLERIRIERRQKWEAAELAKLKAKGKSPKDDKWKSKYVEPEPIDTSDLPELPPTWCWARAQELAANSNYATAIGPFGSSLMAKDYRDEGVPLVFVRDIRSSFSEPASKFVSRTKAIELAPHVVHAGDVLMTKMGDPPGDTAIYPDGPPSAVITADCIKLSPDARLASAHWLAAALGSGECARQVRLGARGVAQQKISLEFFRDIAVPMAPLDEQHVVTAAVANAVRAVDADADQIQGSLSQLERSLLAKAFRGELVT